MIHVKLWGGLGNQLFQYAFGQYVASVLNVQVQYVILNDKVSKNFTARSFDLEKFDFVIDYTTESDIKKYVKFNNGLSKRIERKITKIFPKLNKKYLVQENAHHDVEIFKDDCYYDGYWQNYTYADFLRKEFLEKVKLDASKIEANKELISKIQGSSSVSIHIRRGDYLLKHNREIYNLLEMDYYDAAIEMIREKVQNPLFFIFTQDTDWAKAHFKGDEFYFVIDRSGTEDMLLMSYCKHNIIANSTFSWWGAWLNNNPDKMVFAPIKWYKNKYNKTINNLIPKEWIRI